MCCTDCRKTFNKKIIMNLFFSTFLCFVALSLFGCEDQDDGCGYGEFNLVYDWSSSKSISSNEYLVITPDESASSTIQTDNVGKKLSLQNGGYRFFAYETVPTVTTDGTIFTIKVDENSHIIAPNPFSAGVLSVKVFNTLSKTFYLPMYYQTRELIIRVKYIGETKDDIVSADGLIDNVTLSRKIEEGFPPVDGIGRHEAISNAKARYDFTAKISEDRDVALFVGNLHLLGIDGGESQLLSLFTHFADGDASLSFDITQALDLFHTDRVGEPFVIEITVKVAENFYAEIVDWKSGSISIIEAN